MNVATDPYGHETTTPAKGTPMGDIAAMASVGLGLGALVFSCCCGLLSIPLALLGLAAGGFSAIQPDTNNKIIAYVGLFLNVCALAMFVIGLMFGVGMQALTAFQNAGM